MEIVIADPSARAAVALIDRGDEAGLEAHLRAHARLLAEVIDIGPAAADGGYFARPRLLWFVAENPVRTGRLAPNIADVAGRIVAAMRAAAVPSLNDDLEQTLCLVASGRVARESGLQAPLIGRLVREGADPCPALGPALAHGETAAAEALLAAGAPLTLEAAAGLGREAELRALLTGAPAPDIQNALALAAINGCAEAVRPLVEAGAQPNMFNAEGYHGHTAPLHQAICSGSLETVRALVEMGADIRLRDRSFGGTALGWAVHNAETEIEAWLRAR